MEHDWELIIARLEILEIEVCNILQNPGNIGKRIFWLSPILEILEHWFFYFSHILEISEIWFLLIFGIFTKKTRAEISRRMHRSMGRDLSYETDSGPKTKTVSDPNFQVTAATAAATAASAATTSQQISHLARALDHHAQGPNIPFGVNPSLRQIALRTTRNRMHMLPVVLSLALVQLL